jgi:transcription elongation factor Elf1
LSELGKLSKFGKDRLDHCINKDICFCTLKQTSLKIRQICKICQMSVQSDSKNLPF